MIDPDTVLRASSTLGLILLFGTSVFRVVVAEPALKAEAQLASELQPRLSGMLVLGLVIAFLSGAAWLPFQAAAMSGEPIAAALPIVGTVLGATHFGHVLLARGALLIIALAAIVAPLRRAAAPVILCTAAGLALASGAMLGHAAAIGGARGAVLLVSQAVHLLAAGAWLGSLPGLLLLLIAVGRQSRASPAASAAQRFSPLGMICVGALAITAAVNAAIMTPGPTALVETRYGLLMVAKAAVFLALLALASLNRFRYTPQLALNTPGAVRQLGWSVAVETALGLAVVFLAAVLATTSPPHMAHMH